MSEKPTCTGHIHRVDVYGLWQGDCTEEATCQQTGPDGAIEWRCERHRAYGVLTLQPGWKQTVAPWVASQIEQGWRSPLYAAERTVESPPWPVPPAQEGWEPSEPGRLYVWTGGKREEAAL